MHITDNYDNINKFEINYTKNILDKYNNISNLCINVDNNNSNKNKKLIKTNSNSTNYFRNSSYIYNNPNPSCSFTSGGSNTLSYNK